MWRILALLLAYLAHSTSAHGGALNYTVGETWYPGSALNPTPFQDPPS